MKLGTILVDEQFTFTNGEIGKKILIVLSNVEPFIVVKTTSNAKFKRRYTGCQLKDTYPNFFIPKDILSLKKGNVFSSFKKDTWIGLDNFFEFKTSQLLTKKSNGQIAIIGELKTEFLKPLLNCCMNSQDITNFQVNILQEMMATLKKEVAT